MGHSHLVAGEEGLEEDGITGGVVIQQHLI